MTVVRGNIPKSLVPGVHEFVGLAYGATPEEHKPLYEILTSGRAWEEEVMVSSMGGAPVKGEGQAVAYDDIQETYTSRYQHETVAVGFVVTKEAFDDDQYDTISRAKAQGLGRAMADTKQVKAASTFNRGFDANFAGGDGVALFSAAHPTTSGLQSNLIAADLSEAALEDLAIEISLMQDDRGVLISARPESLHIPAQLEFLAGKILKSQYSGTAVQNVAGTDNVGGILMQPNLIGGKFPKGIHVNRRFTDPDAWFVKTSVPNGTKMFIREALSGSDDTDFDTDNKKFKFRERYSFGWTDWRGFYGSEGA